MDALRRQDSDFAAPAGEGRAQGADFSGITLDDKYRLGEGRVFLTGTHALVRLMIEQARRDASAGLKTAGFVSGYRGSPLGGLDRALWESGDILQEHGIRFQPAVNEELAATALIGTQQAPLYPDATVEGVFGLWYGKGPGLDRAGDALKHANSLGSHPKGGVLVVVGDDHGAMSSSMAHQCEQVMESWMMPVLHPATIQEILDFGLIGFSLSRFSGCWVGLKAVSETVESATNISVGPGRGLSKAPADYAVPEGGLHIRLMDPPLGQEVRLQKNKLPAVHAFARANRLDRIEIDSPRSRIGIVTTGKSHLYTRQALEALGIDDKAAASLGIRLYKIGLAWPLEPDGALRFARGLDKLLVIEEKRAFIETQIKDILYDLPAAERPAVLGKKDDKGKELLSSLGELDAAQVARALARFEPELARGIKARRHLALLDSQDAAAAAPPALRPPYFCSGCPHNSSTKVPEGSRALAGTGCHLMVLGMQRNTSTILHMGGEGVNWIGMAPFLAGSHIFQNLGDGTYVHSGYLGIRQAVASKATMTFKILYNDAVAMTGGQAPEGHPGVGAISRQIRAEGVGEIAVVSDHPERFRHGEKLAEGVRVYHRDELDAVQRRFRELPGVTAIIYDQPCATELRRKRRRGEAAEPGSRVYINTDVCEGCGDCSVQSNCISVMPVETPFGRKREIAQSSCNKDMSCLKGFCPAMVTLDGASLRKHGGVSGDPAAGLPAPRLPAFRRPHGILIAGIGGTGVVTVGQILGVAAHLEGRGAAALDFTGLAQKGGGVLTHLTLYPEPTEEASARLAPGGADLLLAGDMVVATGPEAMKTLRRGHSLAVCNSSMTATANSVLDRDYALDEDALRAHIAQGTGEENAHFVRASALAEALTGDAITANMFLLGLAWQKGAVPLGEAAILRAIELNGVMCDDNKRAFAWGRRAAEDRQAVEKAAGGLDLREEAEDLKDLVERRAAHLVDYKSEAYAQRYRAVVERARKTEKTVCGAEGELTRAVATSLHRLMAFKDEYEVARLYLKGGFGEELRAKFDGPFSLRYHFAPPFLPRGADRRAKRSFGPWFIHVLKALAAMKGLRGTMFDPFARQSERREERRLIGEFESDIDEILEGLTAERFDAALALAALPQSIRGFGPVKEAAIRRAAGQRAELLEAFRNPARAAMVAQ
ncbi:MAG: indolepyruvate ferredoxin oxidoreductase family protein [Rhodobiaceae bacterium]|nr:indolepyruvate ferredoxin oxidoreductase family protein [Rhodobiaceae bacterium]